ncbi:phage tail protein [Bowmanella denitrificans]|uniref:phage tail protein n=1 Tax=Bowmanella denitrificans TaxID=366582 RepID=UPI000C9B7BD9|nr:phage tail protein [Bowmanella denitrificans]
MQKFKALLNYLHQANLVASEKLNHFITECQLQLSGKQVSNGSIVAAYISYEANFEFESYGGDANTILAHVASWVYENGQTDDSEALPPPRFDIEQVDAHQVDVLIEVPFCEALHLQRDDNGPYLFDGQRYSLQPPTIDVAESAEVDGEVCHE